MRPARVAHPASAATKTASTDTPPDANEPVSGQQAGLHHRRCSIDRRFVPGESGRQAASPEVEIIGNDRHALFTPQTLASYLSLSGRTIRDMLKRGEIPSYKIGGARRIDPADVDRYLAQHRQGAREAPS